MALAHERVTVASTATLLSSNSAGRDGQSLLIQNPSTSAALYLGGAGVTTTNYGYLLVSGGEMSITLQNAESLYGVVASTSIVNIIRQGV
jgi:hypothetical protein